MCRDIAKSQTLSLLVLTIAITSSAWCVLLSVQTQDHAAMDSIASEWESAVCELNVMVYLRPFALKGSYAGGESLYCTWRERNYLMRLCVHSLATLLMMSLFTMMIINRCIELISVLWSRIHFLVVVALLVICCLDCDGFWTGWTACDDGILSIALDTLTTPPSAGTVECDHLPFLWMLVVNAVALIVHCFAFQMLAEYSDPWDNIRI